MNAEWWGAAAEWTAVGFTVAGFGGAIAFAMLRTRFVTRSEHVRSHGALSSRIDDVETGLEDKVNKEDLRLLNDRLYATEQSLAQTKNQLAETNGLLKSNTDASRSLERQINMLIENELRGERTRA